MSDLQFSSLILNVLTTYGGPAMAVLLFLSALGVPSPATFSIIAAGALARLGLVDSGSAALLGLLGVVIGDSLVYGLGRFGRAWSNQKFGATAAWQKAQEWVERRGGIAIYLTRWLITAPAIPVTLAAAGGGVSFRRFLAYDVAGELTWILVFGGMGYVFGDQWEQVSDWISAASGPLAALTAVGLAAWLLLRYVQKLRMHRFA